MTQRNASCTSTGYDLVAYSRIYSGHVWRGLEKVCSMFCDNYCTQSEFEGCPHEQNGSDICAVLFSKMKCYFISLS